MGPATLYTTLQRLLDFQLVEEAEMGEDADSRRRTYRLTKSGRALFETELSRLAAVLHRAKAVSWKPKPVKS